MEINRISAELILCTLLMGVFSQLLKVFYHTAQINYLAFMFLRIFVCTVIVTAIYYLKRNRDLGELTLLIFATLIGLWTQN